ncbi:hypothetical protein AOQ84DRAFT_327981 [Glonium stellatum]|uniref:Rhodopsin domain-containing protein n=1 Tax=Glonium stellatum TaxID=574774 RepID=A0A8E2ENR7_9PEZI|nr:hypothetical protein AOQ84DRAFT_327981 [Glonium stellatum]
MLSKRAHTDETRVPQVLTGNIVPLILSSIFVFARFYTKLFINRSWGNDDSMVAVSYVACLTLMVLDCASTIYGIGLHIDAQKSEWMISQGRLVYAQQLVYNFTLTTTKLSICLFYLRVFPDRTSRWLSIGTMIFILLYFIPIEIASIAQCIPVDANWDKSVKGAKCISTLPIFYCASILNIVVDVWLISIVLPRMWRLNLPKRQKIVLTLIASMGWLVVVAATVRFVLLAKAFQKATSDVSWSVVEPITWSAVECNVGLFCVSAPSIQPLLRKLFPSMMRLISNVTSRERSRQHRNYAKHTGQGTFRLSSNETNAPSTNQRTSRSFWRSDRVYGGRTENESEEHVLDATKHDIVATTTISTTTIPA